MNEVLGLTWQAMSFVFGFAMTVGCCWLILSNWLIDKKLILTCVGITAAAYIASALFADGLTLAKRLLFVLGIVVVAAVVAKYWLWRETQKYGSLTDGR